MTIADYKEFAKLANYDEEATFTGEANVELKNFINYEDIGLDLKIYLCELIVYRHFSPLGIINKNDVHWFIQKYFESYESDFIQPERAIPVKEAKALIMTEDTFGKATVGTFFMFGIIEFYAKYKLGFRPNNYNYNDTQKYDYTKQFKRKRKSKDIYLAEAIEILEDLDFPISHSLKKINSKTINKMDELFLSEKGSIRFSISDRLTIARNDMLHGEKFCYFDRGRYMLMLYILFQLNEDYQRKQ